MSRKIIVIAALSIAVAPICISAQGPRTSPRSSVGSKTAIPRTAAGLPDLTGVWQSGSSKPGTWEEANTDGQAGGQDITAGSAPAPVVRDVAPYQPWAAKKVLESFQKRAIDDPTALCLPPGLPRTNLVALFPIQIVQTPSQIVILYEYMSVFRVIPLNAKHPEDLEPNYMGNSVGRWEKDTLVVDVTSFNDKTWLFGAGTFHSEALHVTERFTRVTRDQINYEVIIEDPMVLTKPWTIRSTMMLREGTRIREYVCPENNLDPGRYEELLKNGVDFNRK